MPIPTLKRTWLRLTRWGAIVLGLGTLFAGEAQANRSADRASGPDTSSAKQPGLGPDEVVVRLDEDKVYLCQRGGVFDELVLDETPDVAYLRKLLRDAGAAKGPLTIPVGSIIVANGGGRGDGAHPDQQQVPKLKHKKPLPESNHSRKTND